MVQNQKIGRGLTKWLSRLPKHMFACWQAKRWHGSKERRLKENTLGGILSVETSRPHFTRAVGWSCDLKQKVCKTESCDFQGCTCMYVYVHVYMYACMYTHTDTLQNEKNQHPLPSSSHQKPAVLLGTSREALCPFWYHLCQQHLLETEPGEHLCTVWGLVRMWAWMWAVVGWLGLDV